MTPDGFAARYGQRRYELRAIEQQKAAARLRCVMVKAVHAGRFHIDTVDFTSAVRGAFSSAKWRGCFVKPSKSSRPM